MRDRRDRREKRERGKKIGENTFSRLSRFGPFSQQSYFIGYISTKGIQDND
jgi:hypothetical protein